MHELVRNKPHLHIYEQMEEAHPGIEFLIQIGGIFQNHEPLLCQAHSAGPWQFS